MSSDREQLLSMGFAQDRVDWALKATGNRGLQPAMDYILENEGNPVPDLATVGNSSVSSRAPAPMDTDIEEEDVAAIRAAMGHSEAAASSSSGGAVQNAEAKSIKCSQCEKVFKTVDLANYHAEKSGHDQFEESTEELTPLTEEEKKRKLEDLRQKMAEKKAKKAADEAKENKANELLRRKAGQDQTAAKEELKMKQLAKDQEAKRREKIEDAKAKAAIKAQIEADKKARAEKAAKEKALREGREWNDVGARPAPDAATPAAAFASGAGSSEYKDTRLQIRYPGGGPVMMTLPSNQTLHDVAVELMAKGIVLEVDTVTFTMTFPRYVNGVIERACSQIMRQSYAHA